MPNRLVSIVMPAFNASDSIEESLQSVLRQTYPHWELLVVDDRSTDSTVSKVNAIVDRDPRVRLICLSQHSGSPARPRNSGIEAARGSLLAFLDADDRWSPDKLARQVAFMKEEGAVLSCTGYQVMGSLGRLVDTRLPPAVAGYDDLLRNNTIGCSTSMYDAERLGKRFFPLLGHEDYALWLSILREGHRAHGLPAPLAVHRRRAGSVSANKIRVLTFYWRIYHGQERLSPARSLYLTLRYAFKAGARYVLAHGR